jgi:hypothetical protein
MKAYCEYYGKDEEVLNPHTGETEVWQPLDFLLENARLLWMRRKYGEDVKDYFKEILNDSRINRIPLTKGFNGRMI